MTTLAMPKPHGDRAIEGVMAKWYAANTGEMMHEYAELAERIRGEVPEGSALLEVAPGPGYFCIELAKLGRYSITGLDISHTFVKMAAKRAAEAGGVTGFLLREDGPSGKGRATAPAALGVTAWRVAPAPREEGAGKGAPRAHDGRRRVRAV